MNLREIDEQARSTADAVARRSCASSESGLMKASIPPSAGTTVTARPPLGPSNLTVSAFTVSTWIGCEKRSEMIVAIETLMAPLAGIDPANLGKD